MLTAPVIEIFSSIQGEGPWVGQRQIFVRFGGCNIACQYCDTPGTDESASQSQTSFCSVQRDIASLDHEELPAGVTCRQLTQLCSRLIPPGLARPVLSLTGGEPLLQHSFLAAWLPGMRPRCLVYLETNGICHKAMAGLRNLVDTVSMDFKLPSATGLRPFWDEHKKFLAACRGKSLFGKAVVTRDTAEEDILTAAGLLADHDPSGTLVIQPADGASTPHGRQLLHFQVAALRVIGDVRIIPQVHKMLNIP